MKRIIILTLMLVFNFGFSQSRLEKESPFFKNIKTELTADSQVSFVNNATLSWDYSTLDLSNISVAIEVVTIYDCFNGAQATDFKQQFKVLSSENFSVKGSHQLIHTDLLAKCFNWRAVVTTGSDTQVSDWVYISFLN